MYTRTSKIRGAQARQTRHDRGLSGLHPETRRRLVAASGFLAPFLILLLIFQYIPLYILGRSSFESYTLYNPEVREFVGLDNFVYVFTDPATRQSLFVTLLFVIGMVAIVVPVAFVLAVFLNSKMPARPLVRTVVFLPVVTSQVVVATIFLFMLSESGLLNAALATVGLGPYPFLTDTSFALPAIIAMSAWQQIGLAAVLFIGGLQGIPGEMYEAAEVDGAGAVRRVLSITIPLLSRTTLMIVVVMTVFALQAFAPAMLMTGGAPEGTTNLAIYHIYRMAFYLQQPGVASAISVVVLAFALLVSLIQMRLLRTRWSY